MRENFTVAGHLFKRVSHDQYACDLPHGKILITQPHIRWIAAFVDGGGRSELVNRTGQAKSHMYPETAAAAALREWVNSPSARAVTRAAT